MKFKVIITGCIFVLLISANAKAQKNSFQEDFQSFWQSINNNYAYFDKKQTDWNKVREIYGAQAAQAKTKREFVRVLEMALRELYDNHLQLNTNLPDSSRLVPSSADIWAEWQNGKAIVTNLRKGFGAEKSGLKIGMEIVNFNNQPIAEAIQPFVGKSLKQVDENVKNWALVTLLGGNHETKRIIKAGEKGVVKKYELDEPQSLLENISYPKKLEFGTIEDNLGYIKINNSLGDNELIELFDDALENLKNTKGLILDFRETPSGGNSTVGRAILSRFVKEEKIFQKHSLPAEERESGVRRSWFEIVSPRGLTYEKPLVVLVNRWTGSMGEGIAVGFDGMKRATIVGTEMAGLNGALQTVELPNTKIRFSFPFEKIFHNNGQPRENFKPSILVREFDLQNDQILKVGIKELKKRVSRK